MFLEYLPSYVLPYKSIATSSHGNIYIYIYICSNPPSIPRRGSKKTSSPSSSWDCLPALCPRPFPRSNSLSSESPGLFFGDVFSSPAKTTKKKRNHGFFVEAEEDKTHPVDIQKKGISSEVRCFKGTTSRCFIKLYFFGGSKSWSAAGGSGYL